MYPVLHELERAGYLRRVDRVVNGKVRKYYASTKRGAVALADARKKLRELVDEVLHADAGRERRGPDGSQQRGSEAETGAGDDGEGSRSPVAMPAPPRGG